MSDKNDTIKKGQSNRKQRFLNALLDKNILGNVSVAAANAGINRQLLYRWRNEDSAFALAWDKTKTEADERLVDKAYSALITSIDAGNITAIIFTLKTRAPERWGEVQKKDKDGKIEDLYELSPEFTAALADFYNRHSKNTP